MKLLGGFAVVLVLTAIIAIAGIMQLRSAAKRTDELYHYDLLGMHFATTAQLSMVKSARDEKKTFLATDEAKRTELIKEARADLAEAADAAKSATPTFVEAADQATWVGVMKQLEDVSAARSHVLDLLAANDDTAATAAATAMTADIDKMNAALEKVTTDNLVSSNAAQEAAASSESSAMMLLSGMSVVAILVGLGIGYYIARQMKTSIGVVVNRLSSLQRVCVTNLENGIKSLSAGDLTIDVQPATPLIPNPGKDEVGKAAETVNLVLNQMVSTIASYNEARKGLAGLIGEVQTGASNITNAADSLRENSDQMAAATGQIAVAINEVTRSAVNLSALSHESAQEVERVAAGSQQLAASASTSAHSASQSKEEATQIGSRIQLVATASQEVAAAAEESKSAAQQGQKAVREAVSSMESIATAVQRASQTVDQLGEYGQ
ncbi:MAG: methyl-accepting chemotaxis protein, partial [bacterium]